MFGSVYTSVCVWGGLTLTAIYSFRECKPKRLMCRDVLWIPGNSRGDGERCSEEGKIQMNGNTLSTEKWLPGSNKTTQICCGRESTIRLQKKAVGWTWMLSCLLVEINPELYLTVQRTVASRCTSVNKLLDRSQDCWALAHHGPRPVMFAVFLTFRFSFCLWYSCPQHRWQFDLQEAAQST